jgi:polysaccharide biosynthesis protein PslG
MVRPLLALALVALTMTSCGDSKAPAPAKKAPPPAVKASRGSDFVGIYADDVYFGDADYRRSALRRQRDAGVQLIRQPVAWSDSVRDPARLGDFVGAAAAANVRVLPVLLGPEPDAPAGAGGMRPPTRFERFAGWAALVVQRYGRGGSFWKEHPDLPELAITSWQVWNEPNIPAFWAPKPDPAGYARLLEATGTAIRKVDPRAEVVAAGLPTSHLGMAAPDYLRALYKAGTKGSFDTAAVHPYGATPDAVVANVNAIRRVIRENDDVATVWVTEFGWGTGDGSGALMVTREQQADYISETLTRLKELGVRGAVVFQWRDPKPFPGRREIWPYFAGLNDDQSAPKPALAAFTAAARKAGR